MAAKREMMFWNKGNAYAIGRWIFVRCGFGTEGGQPNAAYAGRARDIAWILKHCIFDTKRIPAARGTLLLVCVKSERHTAYAGRARDIGKKAIQSPASVSKKIQKPRMKNRALFCEDTVFLFAKATPRRFMARRLWRKCCRKALPAAIPKNMCYNTVFSQRLRARYRPMAKIRGIAQI